MAIYLPWIGMLSLVFFFLILDLGVFHKKARDISIQESIVMSGLWVILSLLFNVYVWYARGGEAAIDFFTGYLLEKLLSLDNMFIFLATFHFFAIPLRHQHHVLFWGILGAIVLRLLFILIGIKLIESFEWILYIFGALLIYSSYKMYKNRNKPEGFRASKIINWLQKWIPIKHDYKGGSFFVKVKGTWVATPLFLALLTIELTDVVFAVDSIPAIFAITVDPFIVFTSNIFAILGMRALYFVLAHLSARFYYLQHALSVILGFVGTKLMLANIFVIPTLLSLGVIVCVFAVALFASWRRKKNEKGNRKKIAR